MMIASEPTQDFLDECVGKDPSGSRTRPGKRRQVTVIAEADRRGMGPVRHETLRDEPTHPPSATKPKRVDPARPAHGQVRRVLVRTSVAIPLFFLEGLAQTVPVGASELPAEPGVMSPVGMTLLTGIAFALAFYAVYKALAARRLLRVTQDDSWHKDTQIKDLQESLVRSETLLHEAQNQTRQIEGILAQTRQELTRERDRIRRHEHAEIHNLIQSEKVSLESNRAKDAFLSHMSHEMRTPLNVIIGYSEMVDDACRENGWDTPLPDIKKVASAGQHLLEKINSILELSKIKAGKMQVVYDLFHPVDFADELARTIDAKLAQSGNRFSIEAEEHLETLEGDISKLRQVLLHLLHNAIRFTQDGQITLQIEMRERHGLPWLTFTVRDTGRGIPKNRIERLFRGVLTQTPGVLTERDEGGLGLAICHSLCQMMGGTLDAESVAGEGTTFRVCIPAFTGPILPSKAHPDGPRSILLVHDNEDETQFFISQLEKLNLEIHSACSEEEAVQVADRVRPELLVLNGTMPNFLGLETLLRLQSHPTTSEKPVIMFSMMDRISVTYTLGSLGYLIKPIEEKRIARLATRLLGSPSERPIMVVDDDRVSRRMLSKALEKGDWPVVEAAGGHEALQLLQNQHPALIFLDLMMPEMDGYDFFEHVRKDHRFTEIPIVFITSASPAAESQLHVLGRLTHLGHPSEIKDREFLKQLKKQILLYLSEQNDSRGDRGEVPA